MRITYKLPEEFQLAHAKVLTSWDWRRFPVLSLKEVLPEEVLAANPDLQHVRLTFDGSGGEPKVRPLGGGSAIKLRRYCDTLPQFPKPTREEIAATLAKRNPPKAAVQA